MTLYGTIDSVSMQHLCRAPIIKVQTKRNEEPTPGLDVISKAFSKKILEIFIDEQFGLSDEWKKTCGFENIEPILTHWIELNGVKFCNPVTMKVPRTLGKKLKDAKFLDAGDKLIVRIGLSAIAQHNTVSFMIATNDSDFWDPLDKTKGGNSSAPVALALADHNVHSTQLKDFFMQITV